MEMASSQYARENTEIIGPGSWAKHLCCRYNPSMLAFFKGITNIIDIGQFYNNNLPLPSYFQPRAQYLT